MGCADRRLVGAFAPRFALVVLTVACGTEAAAPSSLGQPMPIGAYTLTVERTQPAPVPGPPISSFREQPGREGFMVVVRWAGLDDLDAMSRIVFAEKYLEDRLSIVDSTVTDRASPRSTAFMPTQHSWRLDRPVPPPVQAGRTSSENLDPAEGQPARFAIVLP
jgi:hypothetical protein